MVPGLFNEEQDKLLRNEFLTSPFFKYNHEWKRIMVINMSNAIKMREKIQRINLS